ncbi:MAG: hypothetical protein QHH06_15615 [Clostridiales bacterium]|jgi:integrase|nr:N-terminal phage integrase SAM-like domain-containing protein [Eubacteriales bacterium]MDH7567862.1 hypothetical protein [Clostridiales bacterium]
MAGRRGNGEGTITRRKDGVWAGTVAVGRNPDGSVSRKWFYGSTRKEVAEKMQGILLSVQKGEYFEQSGMPFGEWLDVWMKDYKRIVLKQTTFDSYETNIRCHLKPKMGHIKLAVSE